MSAKPTEGARPGTVFRDTLKDGSKGPEMVWLPRGGFWMGSPDGEGDDNERPQRRVTIAYDVVIGKYEVTWDEYNACVADGGCRPAKDDGFGGGRRPVTNVDWNDARAYAAWLSEQTGAKYRLPSEAEWEYAARAKSTTAYPWGTEIGRNKANCNGCGSQWDNKSTAPVGSFAASAFGLHDIIGNVWERVEDCYVDNYSAGQAADGSAFTKGSCLGLVYRGGSWNFYPQFLRSAYRYWNSPSGRDNDIGFRVARTL